MTCELTPGEGAQAKGEQRNVQGQDREGHLGNCRQRPVWWAGGDTPPLSPKGVLTMLQEGAGEEAAPRTWVTLEKGGPSPALCRGGVHRSRDPPPLCPVLISSATSPPGLPCVPPELHACDSLSRVCLGETPRDTEGNSRAPWAPDGLRMDSNVSSVPTSLIGKETLRRAASPTHLPVLGDKPGIWGWGGGSELQAPRHSPAWGEGGGAVLLCF